MFTHTLDDQTKASLVRHLASLLESRDKGVTVFATEKDVPAALASLLVTAAKDQLKSPLFNVNGGEARFVLRGGNLEFGKRSQQRTAERTLAATISEEIAAERFVVVALAGVTLGIGSDAQPEHHVCTDEQWETLKPR